MDRKDILIVPCTSQEPRDEFDIPIDWIRYQLEKPTIARVSKIRAVEKRHFIKCIDKLSLYDWKRIQTAIRDLF
jgi:hypothetical protein